MGSVTEQAATASYSNAHSQPRRLDDPREIPGASGDFRGLSPKRAVTPSSETERKFPGCRSLRFARRTKVIGCSMSVAEKAEASTAGEQLAEEYSAGNSSHR